MNFFSNLSIKSKLVYILLTVALGCILVIAYSGLTQGKSALNSKVYDHMIGVRTSKAAHVEEYFEGLRAQLRVLAHDKMIVGAMREFDGAFDRFKNETISDAMLESLSQYYSKEFLPVLAQNVEGSPNIGHYLPSSTTAQYLQYQYVTNNPNQIGKKQDLDQASDRSYYSGVHNYYHPSLRNIAKNFGYYDIFLISLENGDIVYSNAKETDFATSLKTGPYSASNLSRLYKKVYSGQEDGAVWIEDFDFYRPSYGTPAAFLGTTIYDDNKPIGILVLQVPSNQLNNVVTNNGEWEKEGLAKTGEIYLAGNDKLMRTNARSLIEGGDEGCYRQTGAAGGPTDTLSERICRQKSSILMQSVDNTAVNKAIQGESGIEMIKSYTGETMLSSYSPINIDGLNWVVVAQIAASEANIPIHAFQKHLTLITVLLGCIVTFLSMYISGVFTRPMAKLIEGSERLRNGDLSTKIDMQRGDEFGQLANSFNHSVDVIQEQQKVIESREEENSSLLRSILPESVAKRVQEGETNIADRVPNVSVLFASISGFTTYTETLEPQQSADELNYIIRAFDKAAESHGVEKITTVGDSYMSACGLTIAHLDHARRQVAFGKELIRIMQQYNQIKGTNLSLRVGIHSGPVVAGIIGTTRFVYDIWGESVNVASRIRYEAALNSILLTDTVYGRLADQDGFTKQSIIETKGMGVIPTWSWTPSAHHEEVSSTDQTQLLDIDDDEYLNQVPKS